MAELASSDLRWPTGEPLPSPLPARVAGYAWRKNRLGRSSAQVFMGEKEGEVPLVLKLEPAGPLGELPGEVERLAWLRTTGLACPPILACGCDSGFDWLLMTALAGHDLVSHPHLAARDGVALLAQALKAMHALDVNTCPFDQRLDRRLEMARARYEAGLVDEDDFNPANQGRKPSDMLAFLQMEKPSEGYLVVTHGDASLPNFVADNGGKVLGFIDCGRLGVADRSRDLVIALSSIGRNWGEVWVEPFLECYGANRPAENVARYYQTLEDFF